MARNPRVVAKAQAEIDAVVGLERLPDLHDRSSLPYLSCIVSELYRWHVAVPLGIFLHQGSCTFRSMIDLGVPHRLMQDDQYREFDLPGGAMIMANSWCVTLVLE
jgi:hypothetical protein